MRRERSEEEEMPVTSERLTDFERRLRALELELGDLRRADAAPPRPVVRAAEQTPPALTVEPRQPRPPLVDREAVAAGVARLDLLGPRSLAWAGGVVTLLGVVFLFALA